MVYWGSAEEWQAINHGCKGKRREIIESVCCYMSAFIEIM
jgi:hypothetical protein